MSAAGPQLAVAALYGAVVGMALTIQHCNWQGCKARYLAIKALAKKMEAYPWETMENAPKDGTMILAWIPGPKWPVIIFWDEDRWLQTGSRFVVETMTHWCRLPGAPS